MPTTTTTTTTSTTTTAATTTNTTTTTTTTATTSATTTTNTTTVLPLLLCYLKSFTVCPEEGIHLNINYPCPVYLLLCLNTSLHTNNVSKVMMTYIWQNLGKMWVLGCC